MFRLILLTLLSNALAKPYQQVETNFCTDKGPGLFSQGCSSNVTICNHHGKEMWLLCPFDLIYDGSIEECKDQKLVADCNSAASDSQSIVPHAQGERFSPQLASLRLLECPKDEVFDNVKQGCTSPDEVVACRAADEPTESTTSSSGPKTDCEGLADGFFEKEPCSSFFLTCSGGVSRILTCPANLVFDQKLSMCEYPGNVESCNSQPEEGSGEAPVEQPREGSAEGSGGSLRDDQTDFLTEPRLQTDSASEYARKSDAEHTSSDERAVEGSAEASGEPSGAHEDYSGDGVEASGGLSYEASRTYEASGESSGPTSQDAAANPTQAPQVEAMDEPTTPVPETVRAFCDGKADGFYAPGCSSEVIACRGGEASSMLCPNHMLYDEKKRICEYPENVACYVAANENTVHVTCTTEGPSGNGRCSRTFTNCVEGKAFQLTCDEGYVFSEEHRTCAEASKVKECLQSEPAADAGAPVPQPQTTALPEQPVVDTVAPQTTHVPEQPAPGAGYGAPPVETTSLPEQPAADAVPPQPETTPLPEQPAARDLYAAPDNTATRTASC
ncbi:chitin binding Peritrophin-A domain protein [Cooperia oncophora]